VGFGLVEAALALRYAIPGAPEGVPFDRFARCGAVTVSKPSTPLTGGSEDPSIAGAVGSPARRHLANEMPLDRRWCRSGNDHPEGLSLQSRPGFCASNEPVRRPVRGRCPKKGRLPSGLGSNGTRQHEATWNDKPRSRSPEGDRQVEASPLVRRRANVGSQGEIRVTRWGSPTSGLCSARESVPVRRGLGGVWVDTLLGFRLFRGFPPAAVKAPSRLLPSRAWPRPRPEGRGSGCSSGCSDCRIGLSLSRLPPLLRFPTLSERPPRSPKGPRGWPPRVGGQLDALMGFRLFRGFPPAAVKAPTRLLPSRA